MIAFVLSGAGSKGPLQVGAMRALLEAGIAPAFLVGTSAGAINALYVSMRGYSAETLDGLQAQWRTVKTRTVYPGNLFTAGWRLISGKSSLYSSDGVRKLLENSRPEGVSTFGDLALPLYVATVDLVSSRLFVFGEGASAPLVEAVLASATVPIIHPPVDYFGLQLVDGGVLANVAASVAIEKQATEIYVINAGYGGGPREPAQNVVEVAQNTLGTMMAQTLLRDLDYAATDPNVNLHHIHITAFRDVSQQDFSQSDAMVQAGYDTAKAYLAAPAPYLVQPAVLRQPDLGETVPGAREFLPAYLPQLQ
jgi:NTE family protein